MHTGEKRLDIYLRFIMHRRACKLQSLTSICKHRRRVLCNVAQVVRFTLVATRPPARGRPAESRSLRWQPKITRLCGSFQWLNVTPDLAIWKTGREIQRFRSVFCRVCWNELTDTEKRVQFLWGELLETYQSQQHQRCTGYCRESQGRAPHWLLPPLHQRAHPPCSLPESLCLSFHWTTAKAQVVFWWPYIWPGDGATCWI